MIVILLTTQKNSFPIVGRNHSEGKANNQTFPTVDTVDSVQPVADMSAFPQQL